jgi:endoglucanase
MDEPRREFLDALLATPSPSGYETRGQAVWLEYVESFADATRTDDYGNAVAIHEGRGDGPTVAVAGHADEIGYVVRDVTEEGTLRIGPIGGADVTVSRGQHVEVHAGDGDPVPGVVGQTAIHLRDDGDGEDRDEVAGLHVDVGAADEAAARELVTVGDPVTVRGATVDLDGSRLAARGLDNRAGTWVAAETLRRAAERDVDATVAAVSTVQEEVGLNGARMVGFDLAPDAVYAVDVTHATDYPGPDATRRTGVELGAGPVVVRGSTNHPTLVDLAREAAPAAGVDVQLQATGYGTRTDADAFLTARGATPAAYVGVPNRYMHTPVEVVDLDDVEATAALLATVVAEVDASTEFGVV